MTKKCKYCKVIKSIDNFYKDRSSPTGIGYGCKECLKEYQHQYNRKYRSKVTEKSRLKRRNIKKILVSENGGKCCICGYNKYFGVLEFHHKDPSQKDFHIAQTGINKAREEAKKCVLVCSNCHGEIHGNITSLPI